MAIKNFTMTPLISKKFDASAYFNEALFESENFKVIPSLGSLVEGWLLIVPKNHYISFGHIEDTALYEEAQFVLEYVCQKVKSIYGDFVVFEHGAIDCGSVVGCGVDYAHIHIVPVSVDLQTESQRYIADILWTDYPSLEHTKYFVASGSSYLLLKTDENNFKIGVSENIPSQTFRKIIAEKIGLKDEFDWKKYFFENNILKTINQFKSFNKKIIVPKLKPDLL